VDFGDGERPVVAEMRRDVEAVLVELSLRECRRGRDHEND
jgi:hypothetical protein